MLPHIVSSVVVLTSGEISMWLTTQASSFRLRTVSSVLIFSPAFVRISGSNYGAAARGATADICIPSLDGHG